MGDEASGGRALGRAAVWIAVSAVVLLISPWITLPGIDDEVATATAPGLLGAFNARHMFSAIGSSIPTLIGVRLVLALFGKSETGVARTTVTSVRSTIAFSVYLLLVIVQALSIAFWIESLSYEIGYADLVPEPGWRFRFTAVLASLAGATILWWLADRIDATRAATGALALALLAAMVRLVPDAGAFAGGLAMGTHGPLFGLVHLVLPVAMLALAVVLALRTPSRWPVHLTGSLELRSAIDVLAAPAAVAMLARASIGSLSAPELLRAGVISAATIAVAVILHARVTQLSPRRLRWPIAASLGALVIVMASITVPLASSGALAAAFAPGPLEGEARFTITLAAVDRFSDGEAQAMIERLDALGAQATIVSADARQITLRVQAARDSQSVLDALRPNTLALHLVEDFPSVPLPEGVSASSSAPEGSCETLRSFAPSVACQTALERVVDSLDGEVVDGQPTECRLHCLAPSPVVTGADVAGAQVITDQYSGAPVVSATLTESAADRFEDVTAANVGRQLAIVVDGEIVSAPVIRDRIPGGHIQITLGSYRTYDELLGEASNLVTALRSGGTLTSEWTLESIGE